MRRNGLTLVELLAVVAIIALLLALLLPSVQSVRETARRTICANNLAQLAKGMLHVEARDGRFPSGGWGWGWGPEASRGTGVGQPGGWMYVILPFIEQQSLYDMGAGSEAENRAANARRSQTPIPIANCPTRRPATTFPNNIYARNTTIYFVAARTDYAANSGDHKECQYHDQPDYPWKGTGPSDLSVGDAATVGPGGWPANGQCTGIVFQRSVVQAAHVIDGLSYTYLVGEKYLNPDNYLTGRDWSDNTNMFNGNENDTQRTAHPLWPPMQDTRGYASLFFIEPGHQSNCRFGSAHPVSCQFAFCDGSVRSIPYTIDPETHRRLGNRKDGMIPDVAW
jgi:prepilin-type N-terminal cleavage/methylation domain-containing protein